MRTLLEGVVEEGGGKNARISGYRIGGKTGTAQVYVDGVVSSDTHIGSFVGFAPADDPQFAVLVIVEEADVAVDFGSQTAAPFARDILEKTLNYLGIAPETNEEPLAEVAVPDVEGLTPDEAQKALKDAGLSCVMDGVGGRVIGQLPGGGRKPRRGLAGDALRGRPHGGGGKRRGARARRDGPFRGGGQQAAQILRAGDADRGRRRRRVPVSGRRRRSLSHCRRPGDVPVALTQRRFNKDYRGKPNEAECVDPEGSGSCANHWKRRHGNLQRSAPIRER